MLFQEQASKIETLNLLMFYLHDMQLQNFSSIQFSPFSNFMEQYFTNQILYEMGLNYVGEQILS